MYYMISDLFWALRETLIFSRIFLLFIKCIRYTFLGGQTDSGRCGVTRVARLCLCVVQARCGAHRGMMVSIMKCSQNISHSLASHWLVLAILASDWLTGPMSRCGDGEEALIRLPGHHAQDISITPLLFSSQPAPARGHDRCQRS